VLLDGAHSVGQIPVDVKTLDCDFYAIAGYKWLLGPYPSAGLYIRSDWLDRLQVTWTGSRATKTASVTMDVHELNWVDGAKRFEYGGRTFSYDTAMVTGISYLEQLGLENVQAHARKLTAQLHEGVKGIPGAKLNSPCKLEETTGIVNVSLANVDGAFFSNALRDHWKMITRPALWGTSVRISLACFIDEQDVDNLIENIATLAKG
jgi:selenocysteine lyase/cysteine desulfurase